MMDEELLEKYKKCNIFIGDIFRTPKAVKEYKGKNHITELIIPVESHIFRDTKEQKT